MDSSTDAAPGHRSSTHDPVLWSFLRTTDEAEADRLLNGLLCERAAETVRQVVRRVLHSCGPHQWSPADVEDANADALTRVVRLLRGLRRDAARSPLLSFDAYVARIAEHVCFDYFRRRRPARARLRNQVWYVLTHDPAVAVDRGPAGQWLCRLVAGPAASGLPAAGRDSRPKVPILVRMALAERGQTVELNDLVDLVAERLGTREWPTMVPAIDSVLESLPDPAPSPSVALEIEEYLERLWIGVLELPLRQRTALLLNLRDDQGGDALDLLPRTGIASIRDIAAALAIEAEDLARLWRDLPLDDHRIAQRLGVSRQQVINLRKAARARLGRRLSILHAPPGSSVGSRPGNNAAISDSRERERTPRGHA